MDLRQVKSKLDKLNQEISDFKIQRDQAQVYKRVSDHIVKKQGWDATPTEKEVKDVYDADMKSLEDSRNAFSPAITNNELIAGAIKTLFKENERLQIEIKAFEQGVTDIAAKNPDELASQLSTANATILKLQGDNAAKVSELANMTNELGKVKADASTAHAEKKGALDALLDRHAKLREAAKRYDDLNDKYKIELTKNMPLVGARHPPPPSDASGTAELNDTVSKLLRELQLLRHKAGDISVDEKIKQVVEAINNAFNATTRDSAKKEILQLIVRRWGGSRLSRSIDENLKKMGDSV